MNNSYLKTSFGWALLLALLCGCSHESDITGSHSASDAERRPLGIAALSALADAVPTHTADALHTRAAAITPLPTDGEVGFFVQASGTDYAAVSNRQGSYVADEALWLPTDSIWLTGVKTNIAVYYPYDASQTTAGALKLTSAVRTDASKDLWSTHFEANNRTKDIKLTLTQLYSRLSITFVKLADAEYTGTSALKQLKLEGAGIYDEATYHPLDGTYTYGDAGYTAALTGITIKGTDPKATDATKVDLLLPPYKTLAEDLTIIATVDTKEMKIIIPKAKLANTLAAGKQYNLLVKLKPMALVLGDIKTTDWDSQTAWNEEAAFVPELPKNAIDIGLDFYIADGNVVATSDGNGGYTYAFAEEQGYYSGVNETAYDSAGGDYFCWNDLAPGSTNVSQTEWDDKRDVCRKIGDGGWYTPTQAQLKALANAESVWGEGIYKMKDGPARNGQYFGTTTVPNQADQDKYVFLPAAGLSSADISNWFNVGESGHYWSDTYNDGESDESEAHYFYFREDYTDVLSDLCYSYMPVRCVRDK